MPDRKLTSLHSPSSPNIEADKAAPSFVTRHVDAIDWVLRLSIVLGLIGLLTYAVLQTQIKVWQMWLDVAGIVAAMFCTIVSRRYLRRSNLEVAGYWTLAAILCGFGIGELGWIDSAPLEAFFAPAIILLAAYLIRPRRWYIWVASAIGYVVYVALLDRWSPLPRIPIDTIPALTLVFTIPGAVLILALLTRVARSFRIGTIRVRLIIAFLSVALVPMGLLVGITYFSRRDATLQNARLTLSIAATQLADRLDNLMTTYLTTVEAEAQIPALAHHLALSATDRNSSFQRLEITGLLQALAQKDRDNISSYALLDERGIDLLDTFAPDIGLDKSDRDYFRQPFATGQAYISPLRYSPTAADVYGIYFSSPIRDSAGKIIGVLRMRYKAAGLLSFLQESTGLAGPESFAVLVDENHIRLADSETPELSFKSIVPLDSALLKKLQAEGRLPDRPAGELATNMPEFDHFLTNANTERFFEGPSHPDGIVDQAAVANLTVQKWLLIVLQPQSVLLTQINEQINSLAFFALIVAVLVVAVAVGVSRVLARPITNLTAVAEQVAAGDLTIRAIESDDDVGQLAVTFNSMTAQLRTMIGSLEDRVASRTEELRASAEVGRAAASTLDTDQLLSQIVNLIVERFGLYYAAVFTLNETGQTAVLREASGEAGRTLKERHHQLEVGGQSMVGYVTAHRKARVALDVGDEAVRFANPLLSHTRSEIALPLIVGDRILGALDVQSTQAAAFDEASAGVLQSMADQIAVALSNAEQFSQTSAALQRAENLSESILALVDASDAQEVGQYLAQYANKLVAAHRTAVYIVDHDLKQISAQAAVGYVADEDEITYDLLNSGISGLVFRSSQPVLSLSADDGIEPAETVERRRRNGTGALIVVPLVAQGQVIGTVTVSNLIGQRLFTQRDVDLLMTLSAQSVNVIEKLRLFEQAQRALSDLDAVNRRLTNEAWGDFTLRRAATGTRWIGTTDRAQQAALPEVGEAMSGGQIATRLLAGTGQLGIAVPIKVRDVSIGALRLVVPQAAWTDELRTTLDSIAGHVAQAAENARLIEQTQRTAQREKAIAGAADKIHRSTELDGVLHTAINEINRITGLAGVSIQLGFGQVEAAEGNGHGATS